MDNFNIDSMAQAMGVAPAAVAVPRPKRIIKVNTGPKIVNVSAGKVRHPLDKKMKSKAASKPRKKAAAKKKPLAAVRKSVPLRAAISEAAALTRFKTRQSKIHDALKAGKSIAKLGTFNAFYGMYGTPPPIEPRVGLTKAGSACVAYALPRGKTNRQVQSLYKKCSKYYSKLRGKKPAGLAGVNPYIFDGLASRTHKFAYSDADKLKAFQKLSAVRSAKKTASKPKLTLSKAHVESQRQKMINQVLADLNS